MDVEDARGTDCNRMPFTPPLVAGGVDSFPPDTAA